MDTGDDQQSFFSAARPNLSVELAGLELLRRLLFGNQQKTNPLQNPRLQPIPNFQGSPQMLQPMYRSQEVLPGQVPNQQGKPPKFQMRFAGERDDLLREIDNTIYNGGNPVPTPTPTPQTRFFPVSYFT